MNLGTENISKLAYCIRSSLFFSYQMNQRENLVLRRNKSVSVTQLTLWLRPSDVTAYCNLFWYPCTNEKLNILNVGSRIVQLVREKKFDLVNFEKWKSKKNFWSTFCLCLNHKPIISLKYIDSILVLCFIL